MVQKITKTKITEIEQYENTGIKQRTNNKTLNKIYDQGKEISRKLEFRRGARKHIHTINGTTDKQQILDHIKKVYTDLYKTQNISLEAINEYLKDFNPPELNENQQKNLNKLISETEVKNAIRQLKTNKSPGSDGLSPEFYKKIRHSVSTNSDICLQQYFRR